MAEVPYTPNPATISKFLDHVQNSGIPSKVSQQYLSTVGFKSSNDRMLIRVLKAVHFLDSSGTPTQLWKAYRDRSKAQGVLAEGIRRGYSNLFATYSDAYRKDDEAIQNYFAGVSSLSKNTLTFAVRTFKTLCALANFETDASEALDLDQTDSPPQGPVVTLGQSIPSVQRGGGPTVAINIELQIPATDNAEVYENLFASMKRHLFPS